MSMRVVHDRCAGRADTLMVLLPGALQQPEHLVQAGFAEAVRARGLAADVALVGFALERIGDYSNGSALELLHAGLLAEAARHYAQVWLCGISIGGALAAGYADAYPGAVHGLCLLAPYPGNGLIVGAIRDAGGPLRWVPPQGDAEVEVRLWRCLRQAGERGIRLHLAYGEQDRYAAAFAMMASALDPRQVHAIPGGHDLQAWRPLWQDFVDRCATGCP